MPLSTIFQLYRGVKEKKKLMHISETGYGRKTMSIAHIVL
jgi:hypothetical protein